MKIWDNKYSVGTILVLDYFDGNIITIINIIIVLIIKVYRQTHIITYPQLALRC